MYKVDGVFYFSGLNDFISEVKDKPTAPGRNNESMSSGSSFSGTSSIEQAWEMLEKGDSGKVGADVLHELEKLNLKSTRLTQFNDVAGFAPNVPNYLMGVPKTMINREVKIFRDKIVNVLINNSVSGGTSTEFIVKTAVEIVEVILKLEQEGYRVNIYKMIGASSGYGRRAESILGFIKLKSDRERINLKKLLFPLTHPAMQRRLDFRFREVMPDSHDCTHSGYGSQSGWSKEFVTEAFKRLCSGDFLYANLHDYDPDWYKKLDTSEDDTRHYGKASGATTGKGLAF